MQVALPSGSEPGLLPTNRQGFFYSWLATHGHGTVTGGIYGRQVRLHSYIQMCAPAPCMVDSGISKPEHAIDLGKLGARASLLDSFLCIYGTFKFSVFNFPSTWLCSFLVDHTMSNITPKVNRSGRQTTRSAFNFNRAKFRRHVVANIVRLTFITTVWRSLTICWLVLDLIWA